MTNIKRSPSRARRGSVEVAVSDLKADRTVDIHHPGRDRHLALSGEGRRRKTVDTGCCSSSSFGFSRCGRHPSGSEPAAAGEHYPWARSGRSRAAVPARTP
jgi:hypothetical protein